MDYFLLVATVTLILQVAVFVLLLGGYILRRMGRFRMHGFFMFLGVVVHLVSVGVVMVPSFVEGVVPLSVSVGLDFLIGLTFVHAVLGSVVLVLGLWIIACWRFRKGLEFCSPRRKWMIVTFLAWLVVLLMGLGGFLGFYGKALFG